MWPHLCVCVCALVRDHVRTGGVPSLTGINDSGALMDDQVSERLSGFINL